MQKDCFASPRIFIKETWVEVKTSKNKKNVFVGEDKYFEINQAFLLVGKIHRNVIMYINLIKQSGIWEWWPRFAREQFDFQVIIDGEVPKPSIDGNIQIIFYLLL